ncbi:Bifunctional glutamine synthetase adenylyltransferase/adenylyl-removing enzyme [Sinobacterium norvegicum]|uniref:Bifunctional glutamine synthetase adenylyltransferase/adenylyl-removing enzyme n=1 Tax=Sinobacterium norvegicum TaxID=1641715 RepID=A0ABM9AHY8_9GAMM|nr:bifunctional [glutamate--ammonia ligase]-adenylyl-L-tyrosine phosphorylase/[glutamate--ammonia-ligase] adenylyltransferase [Sinobacterium norvegicum]CAH0992842.1 Bifunctional glutamine synthetase adenylyltransferase/adenylyl-removing enzyme [Sinobacterium norvegicum]
MDQLSLDFLPVELAEQLASHWTSIRLAAEEQGLALDAAIQLRAVEQGELGKQLAMAMVGSEFFIDQCRRNPAMLMTLLQRDLLHRKVNAVELRGSLAKFLAEVEDFDQLCRAIRQFRNRQMCRIIFRDFNRLASMQDTTAELSALADCCIDLSLQWLYQRQCADMGTPVNEAGMPQRMVVVGMGKLGAGELNLSSDIDLIFAFPERGQTRGGKKEIDNQTFFLKLGQQLIKALDQHTADGFVFRVDMRLRPWGQSGALALNFDAFEAYYRDHGREWERYAMIKARIVAGDMLNGEQLMGMLRPFVYRKYVDYSVIDALRSMKQMITREVARRGLNNDVKLGSGGIREIEFIAQVFQLIRGGRDVELQDRRLLRNLKLLKEYEYLPAEAVDELDAAYRFLRNSEHVIQGYQDKQTQALPMEEIHRLRHAVVMGFSDWQSYSEALDIHRSAVAMHFKYLIADPDEDQQNDEVGKEWGDIWLGIAEQQQAVEWLHRHGFDEVDDAWRQLCLLRDSKRVQMMQEAGRKRLDAFMPRLLAAVSEQENASALLLRMIPFVEAVLRRSAYMVLLMENPQALEQLVILCAASRWIAKQLADRPALLDELLNVESLYTVPDKQTLADELRTQLLRLPEDDLEGQMDVLRYFRSAHVLHVMASEVTGRLPLMKVSDYLTFIAEVILQQVIDLAWAAMTLKHGRPQRQGGGACDPGFIIVGYGKLGGLEMGHASDLDLVFLHDGDIMADTDGDKPISGQVFFTRLGQKIIHFLTTTTTQGELYEVDMRLRPSGNSGLLVSSLAAFERYEKNDAWTWEHQALVRSRAVAGDQQLMARFESLRRELLCQSRDPAKLRSEVTAMRHKMSEHLLPKGAKDHSTEVFHLKHGSGGIVDIEFMVQFAVLALAHRHNELAEWSDNIRILETLSQSQLLFGDKTEAIAEAYKAYRASSHRLAVQQRENTVSTDQYVEERKLVTDMWQQYLS